MYKIRKAIAIMVTLVITLSLLISPITEVYASMPETAFQTAKAPSLVNPGVVSQPQYGSGIPLRLRKEVPARATGVSYKLRPGVESLPSGIGYAVEQIKLEELAAIDKENAASEGQAIDPDKVKGIKYNPGSKYLVLPGNALSTFKPEKNKIYIDENEGTAFRMLGTGGSNSDGDSRYVVETPALTDIFETYTIPRQDIKLTTGNIAYMAPGVALAPESGMQGNYLAYAGDNGYISGYRHENNKHILTLTNNKIIFRYPSEEEEKKAAEGEKKAEKTKFEGDWWEREQNSDLRGFKDEDELKVEVAIKEGTIVIEDPTFHADFDLNWLTTQVKADFYFESKTKADVTFTGDLKINKNMEACIFGYDIDLGSVLGKERCNKAFVGVFLVLGANGKVHVEVRTIATGDARAGFAYKAFGYGFIPYSVGPYVSYKPTSFDAAFSANGELHATLACVPQVGVIIWGTEIGALQIWLGFKADAAFSASGGISTEGNASINSKGSLDLKAFAEMIGYLFGKRYSIFYLDFPIYHGEWDVGAQISGGAGDAIRTAPASFLVKADASTNIIEGKIVFDTDSKPLANKVYAIEVWNSGKLKTTLPGVTDSEGKFRSNPAAYNLIPTDKLVVYIVQSEIVQIGNVKYKVEGRSKEIAATVPFTSMDFNVDTFNDVISGTVSGMYSGPVDIKVVKLDFSETRYTANAVNGVFTLSAPINENTFNVWGEINFEGSKFPDNQGVCRTPNLDALDINFYNEYITVGDNIGINSGIKLPGPNVPLELGKLPGKASDIGMNEDDEGNKVIRPARVFGTVTNKGEMGTVKVNGDSYSRGLGTNTTGAQAFTGGVKITALPIKSAILDVINKRDHSNLTDPIVNSSGWTYTTQAQPAMFDGRPTAAATFEFRNPEVLAYTLEIEYEGLKKTERYNPFVFHYERTLQSVEEFAGPVQKAATLVTEEKKDAVVNPGDNLNIWQADWNTSMGRLQLIQTGRVVTGTIADGNSIISIEGEVSGNKFTGSFYDGAQIGTIELEMAPDGKSIKGGFMGMSLNNSIRSLTGTKLLLP